MRRASALLGRLVAPPVRTTQERYRHELKYLINEGEHAALACRMAPVFKLDKHAQAGGYTIRSLYFDDYSTRPTRKKTPVFSCAKSIACASITAATR
ncbi:MAG: hypothetical protein ACLU37_13145 [Collinsella sp.]